MISKFFDRFTAKSHSFVVKENNLIEVMKMFNAALFAFILIQSPPLECRRRELSVRVRRGCFR